MDSTRRHFLQRAAGVALCAQFPFHGIAQNRSAGDDRRPENEAPDPLAGVSAEAFEAWIGSRFRATLNRRPAGILTLVSVTAAESPTVPSSARGPAAAPAVTSFSLRFSKVGAPLIQATYTLEHEWLGAFQLLLVPSGLRTTPATCTAVFTLLN